MPIYLLGVVGRCYAQHVQVTLCVGNVHSSNYFQIKGIDGLCMSNIEERANRGGKGDKREERVRQKL